MEQEKRSSGILLPVFSLPSRYGIGCFSAEAYSWIDILNRAGQRYWQLLPMGPADETGSPYLPLSSFAGNPFFIDLSRLVAEGRLKEDDVDRVATAKEQNIVDYPHLAQYRWRLLRQAFSCIKTDRWMEQFQEENRYWLEDYALFMALKHHFGESLSWNCWEPALRDREPETMEEYKEKLSEEVSFHKWTQYEFFREWEGIHGYAKEKNISVIGDMPMYVSYESADCWAHSRLFQLDTRKQPRRIAGVPPDGFSATGQIWGNPVYRWEANEEEQYQWWVQRVKRNVALYDVLRLDHFRGFDAFYSLDGDAVDGKDGQWNPGSGSRLFSVLQKEIPKASFIAENLGFLTDSVETLRQHLAIPGTKVLQFAFDGDSGNEYLPHNYSKDMVAYTGTHDNDTLKGWYTSLSWEQRQYICRYLGLETEEASVDRVVDCLIAIVQSSVAGLVIIPAQDFLHLGSRARCNTPGTVGNNWSWRMSPRQFTSELADSIKERCRIYGRC